MASLPAPSADKPPQISASAQAQGHVQTQADNRALCKAENGRRFRLFCIRRSDDRHRSRPSTDSGLHPQPSLTSPETATVSASSHSRSDPDPESNRAATLIQKTYRGYRIRRELDSHGVDASTRWLSAIHEAQFRHQITPRARPKSEPLGAEAGPAAVVPSSSSSSPASTGAGLPLRSHRARSNWRKAAVIVRHANHNVDMMPSSSLSSSSSPPPSASSHIRPPSAPSSSSRPSTPARAERRRAREAENAHRHQVALVMKLEYFLEMVDLRHRYGSNLRAYHSVWKAADTSENFFYWLDHGEGREIELNACPRERLEREQVRYLSRDERQYYLVEVDPDGRLCWAKNGARIDTSVEFRDSIHGIVPTDDPTPAYAAPTRASGTHGRDSPSSLPSSSSHPRHSASASASASAYDSASASSPSSSPSSAAVSASRRYPTPKLDDAKGLKKIRRISATNIVNRLLRRSVRKNTWIFVADTSFRLYVGIKASGAFQHSSFLQGSRISAAGLIRIRNGRLVSLSPLSGHYRPPASSFRAFVSSLRAAGVDMSRVSVSKAYVVLLGLEAYMETKRKGKEARDRVQRRAGDILHPDAARRREEERQDKSESADKEKRALEREEDMRRENRVRLRFMQKLGIGPRVPAGQKGPASPVEGVAMAPSGAAFEGEQ